MEKMTDTFWGFSGRMFNRYPNNNCSPGHAYGRTKSKQHNHENEDSLCAGLCRRFTVKRKVPAKKGPTDNSNRIRFAYLLLSGSPSCQVKLKRGGLFFRFFVGNVALEFKKIPVKVYVMVGVGEVFVNVFVRNAHDVFVQDNLIQPVEGAYEAG